MVTALVVTRSREVAASDSCELIELYPGYPEYEGFVTGISGPGDAVCLEELEDRYVRFDKRDEDRANRQAARNLGISGSMEDWTWENWLAIEGERRLPHACYSCNILDPQARRGTHRMEVDREDPRLLSGKWDDTFLIDMARQQYAGVSYGGPVQDYQYRALVSLVYGDPFLNAPQLLDSYDAYGREWLAQYYQPGGEYLLASGLWNRVLDWGGYFPVPESSSPEDQEFVVRVAFAGIHAFPMYPDDVLTGFMGMLQRAIQDWKVEIMQGGRQSLRDYLISIGARNWYL
jgi:hypothetical protein